MTDVYKFVKKAFTVSVVATTIMWSVGASVLVTGVANAATCTNKPNVKHLGVLMSDKAGETAQFVMAEDGTISYVEGGWQIKTWNYDAKATAGTYTEPGYMPIVQMPEACMTDLKWAKSPISPRPGTMITKYGTSQKYYVTDNYKVRKLSDAAATAMYPTGYKSFSASVQYWLFFDESTEAEIATTDLPKLPNLLVYDTVNKKYYVVSDTTGNAKEVTAAGMTANKLHAGYAYQADATAMAMLKIATTKVEAMDTTLVNMTKNAGTGASTTTPPVVAGDLTFALSATSPTGATIPKSASNVEVLKFTVTNSGSSALTLDEVTLKRSGAGLTTGLTAYIYDGDMRKGSGKTFASDTNTADFSVLGISVAAGATKTLSVRLQTGTTAGEHAFSVTAASGTNVTAKGLPIVGNTFSVSSAVSAGTITIAKNSTLSNPTVGDLNATLSQFMLTGASEDLMLQSLTLKQDGTLKNSELSNFKLSQGTTSIPVTATVDDKYLTLKLTTPFKLVDGSGKIFTLKGDIDSGADVGDTIKFFMDKTTDIQAVGVSYGYGATATVTMDSTAANHHVLTLAGGGLTISNLSESAHDVKTDTTEVILGKVAMKAVSDTMEVQKMTALIETTKVASSSSNTGDWGTYRDVTDAGTYDSADTLLLRNIKLKDADTGKTLGSAQAITDAVGATVNGTTYTLWSAAKDVDATLVFQWTDYFTVKKGETRNVVIVADINSAQISGVVYTASFDFTTNNLTVKDSQDNTVTDVVPASTVASNPITTRTSSLTISRASTPESRTVVKGSTVDALAMIWAAGTGTGNDVKISSVVLDTYVNASSTEATYALNTETENSVAHTANMLVTSVSLYDGTTLIAGPVSVDSNGRANFTTSKFVGGYYELAAGSVKTITVKAVVSGNAPYGLVDDQFAFTLDADDVTAEDANGSVTPTVTGTDVNGTTSPTVEITVTGNGTITVAANGGKPTAQVVVAGLATEQEVHRIDLSALKEDFKVETLTVYVDESGSYDNVNYVQLYDANGVKLGNSNVSLDSNGLAKFTGLDFLVPKSDSKVIVVKAKLNSMGERTTATSSVAGSGADSGDDLTFKIKTNDTYFRAVGQSSGTVDTTADTADGNTMVVRNSKLTFALMTPPSSILSTGQNTIMKFSVTADAAGDVVLGAVTPYITFGDSDAGNELTMTSGTLYAYDVTGGGSTLLNAVGATSTVSTTAAYTIDFDTSSVVTIAAGTTRTFEIKANFTGTEVNDSIQTKFVQDTSALTGTTETFADAIADANGDDFIWSDKGADTNGTDSTEWINSYLLYGWPSTVTTLSK